MTDSSRVRISIVGVVVVALFGALLARLWFLQVGSNETYVAAIEQNTTRVVQTENARGRILDREGRVLVDNQVLWAMTIKRDLPDERRALVLGRVSELLGEPHTPEALEERIADPRGSLLLPAVIAIDVPEDARTAVLEHREDFPGIDVTKLTVRRYPAGAVASHVLGYVGEINEVELERNADDGYVLTDSIGKSGVERVYEDALRGEPRRVTYEVDATGEIVGDPVDTVEGSVGDDVRLTIDLDIQRLAQESLEQGILLAREQRNRDIEERLEKYKAPGGSVVVLDARDGGVVAMASYPNYDPAQFVAGIPASTWEYWSTEESAYPLLNRATQGQYAPGSTFKLVTALAGLEYGFRTQYTPVQDNGSVEIYGRTFRNAGGTAHGTVDLREALAVSSDVYFYTLGESFWETWAGNDEVRGEGIQAVARRYGFGESTGIELEEAGGVIPDDEWKAEFVDANVDDPDERADRRRWYPGDTVNLSIGQGDVYVTPVQLANAYAAFANGGTLFQPRVADAIVGADGSIEEISPSTLRSVELDPAHRQPVLDGLVGAVRDERGTAAGAFGGFPFDAVSVAGKTGTAQVPGKGDTSLFAGFFPVEAPQYVVVAIVEEGGFGSTIAAPIVRRIIEGISGVGVDGGVQLGSGID
ncbi:MAG TPA: penicillin-binding protein 2 [Acidimicrobiia bacterium]|nr:penicillin-binding protein 2 [Acidimicrobiia bacterium]